MTRTRAALTCALSLPVLCAALAGCASAPKPRPDPAAEAAAALVQKEKRLVALIREGGIEQKGPAQDEAMALIAELSGKDPSTDPKGFQEAVLPTMLAAAKKHDPRVHRAMLSFRCRSMQAEVIENLKALYAAEESFRAENERYGSLDEVGFAPKAEHYEYAMESNDDLSFVAHGRGTGEMDGDLWRVSHGGAEPESLVNRCDEYR